MNFSTFEFQSERTSQKVAAVCVNVLRNMKKYTTSDVGVLVVYWRGTPCFVAFLVSWDLFADCRVTSHQLPA